MAADDDDQAIVLAHDGSMRARGSRLRASLGKAAGQYRVSDTRVGLLLLQRQDDGNRRARVLMAGEIISRTSVMEVLNVIALNMWRGELFVDGPSGARRLDLEQGALKSASSTVDSERLGEVMSSSGFLTEDQLASCIQDTHRDRRIGELAIDKGYVTREQLFEALRLQMQRIFQNALLEESGTYALLQHETGGETVNVPALMLHLPLQGLLMESMQRDDEMALFRERVPSGQARPVLTGRSPRVSIADSLRPVAALADGEHNILEIAAALHSDEFETTKRVCQLMQVGVLELAAQRTIEQRAARHMLELFNKLLAQIASTAQPFAPKQGLREALNTWLSSREFARYFDGAWQAPSEAELAGALGFDVRAVVERFDDSSDALSIEVLHQALHELVAFAMLWAGGCVPREAEHALALAIGQQLAALRVASRD